LLIKKRQSSDRENQRKDSSAKPKRGVKSDRLLGGTVLPGSPADFGRLIADETEKWAKVVKFSGAKLD
jgi:hypothetical protein